MKQSHWLPAFSLLSACTHRRRSERTGPLLGQWCTKSELFIQFLFRKVAQAFRLFFIIIIIENIPIHEGVWASLDSDIIQRGTPVGLNPLGSRNLLQPHSDSALPLSQDILFWQFGVLGDVVLRCPSLFHFFLPKDPGGSNFNLYNVFFLCFLKVFQVFSLCFHMPFLLTFQMEATLGHELIRDSIQLKKKSITPGIKNVNKNNLAKNKKNIQMLLSQRHNQFPFV